jgi:multidrug efflux system outer membrane protein
MPKPTCTKCSASATLLEHALAVLVGASPSAPLIAAVPTRPCCRCRRRFRSACRPACWASVRTWPASVANLRAASTPRSAWPKGAFYPALSLTGNFGFASESLRNLAKGSARQFSIGPLALSLPVFDGGRNKANLACPRRATTKRSPTTRPAC